MKSDDCSLPPEQLEAVRRQAELALLAASAFGRFPTPVAEVMKTAKVVVAQEEALNEGFLAKLRRKAGNALKRAINKVLGVLDARARLIYIDRAVHVVKQTFLKLHETAHAFMPWQRDLYVVVEDCEKTISPEVSEQFDREANVFASEVLFQLDHFSKEAADYDFGIRVPLKLSKKYGASVYSAVRRYVSTNHRPCVVLILNPPELIAGHGFQASLRRVVASDTFRMSFGPFEWPEVFTPGVGLGSMIPLGGRKMSGPRSWILVDRNGIRHECIVEAFTQTYQVFLLICPVAVLAKMTVIVP